MLDDSISYYYCVITCYLDYSQPKERYVYHKTDFSLMRRQLVLSNWTKKFMIQNQSKSVDELWNSLKSEIHEIRNKFVPKQLSGIPSWKTKGSVPINQVLCYAIRNKRKLHRQWISSKNVLNVSDSENVRQAYTKVRNKVKAIMRKLKREFERNIGIQSKSNPKIFWSNVRSKLKTKTGVAPLLQDKKDETSTKFDDKEKTNILQKQFVSVNKSCRPDEMHPQILIELVDLVLNL